MNNLILVFVLSFCSLFSFSGNDLDGFRESFRQVENRTTAESFLKREITVSDLRDKITINAYKGVCKMMMAEYVSNPISKYNWFNEGKEMLEKSIKMNRNVENIHLRLMVQLNAPSFLGYGKNIEKDVNYIKKNLEKSSVSDETKKMIITNLMANDKENRFEELAKKYKVG